MALMPQRLRGRDKARERHRPTLRPCSATGPQQVRPHVIHPYGPYGVHVRSTGRDTWAALVRSARETAGLPKIELARRLGIDRATISRWEAGANRPEDAAIVQRFAELFGIDLDEALIVAGLRPATAARPQRGASQRLDPEVQRLIDIMTDASTTNETREQILALLRSLNELAKNRPQRPTRRSAS